jgi:hypothetical protein
MHYRLYRVDKVGERVLISEYGTLQAGWMAGQDAVHASGAEEHAYALFSTTGQRVARFGFSRTLSSQLYLPGLVL